MGRFSAHAYIAATAVAVFAACLLGRLGGESAVAVIDNLGLAAFALWAAISAALAARHARGRQRAAWICLAIGATGWMLGSLIWSYFETWLHTAPFPSPADIGFLIFPVATFTGVVLLAVGLADQSFTRQLLDGIIVTTSLLGVSYLLVLKNMYAEQDQSRFAKGLSLTYPMLDVVVVTVALVLLARTRPGRRRTPALLAAGLVLMALADGAFAVFTSHSDYVSGNPIDVGWAAGMAFIALAARASMRDPKVVERTPVVPSSASQWLPYAPLSAAAVLCTATFLSIPGMAPVVLGVTVTAVALLVRQFIVVSENRRLLTAVADQAARDPLTGAEHPVTFNGRLAHAVTRHIREQRSLAVLSLDLDDFKLVNDNLGHRVGDAVLVMAAQRIEAAVRPGDAVGRLGGDEFAVLMEGVAVGEPMRMAIQVAKAFDEPFVFGEQQFQVRPSIGLAQVLGGEPGVSAEALLRRSAVAMYTAKRQHAGRVRSYAPGMREPDSDKSAAFGGARGCDTSEGAAAVRLFGELRDAIDNKELTVDYQPKVDMFTEDIVGVEALIRWQHPERGLLSPDEFLPLVQRRDMMRVITSYVLDQALEDVALWHSKGVGVPAAVNLFAPSLEDQDLPNQILRSLDGRGLRPEDLTLEITENLLLDNMDAARSVVDRLRARGIRVSIDDFGTGYSGLWYLRDLPVDELKLDRQYIAPLLRDRRSAAIVRTVVELAHELGVTTVAEGVESADIATRLASYGCDLGQGYHYSPPLSGAKTLELLTSATRAPV